MFSIISVLIVFFGGTMEIDTGRQSLTSLKSDIEKLFDSTEGVYALTFLNISDETERVLINENEMFHAASTMKTPVMIEVYRQAAEGKFSLDDSVEVKNEFRSIVDGSIYSMSIDRDGGERLYEKLGSSVPIRELVHEMITVSGNLPTNILIDLVGAENVTETMRDLGADNIQVRRGVEDMKAFESGLNNETSAMDLLMIYKNLALGSIVSEEVCREMIGILSEQEFSDLIPAKLPQTVKIAHKTGAITGVQHDSGIVFLPDGRKYILVILSKHVPDLKAGKEIIAQASRMVYDYMTRY
jgi:beta-lactamase class A